MIPDKIYTDNRGVYAELPIFSQANANIEYIRKDALVEWAEDIKAKTGWYEIEVAMDDLIDKLNSM